MEEHQFLRLLDLFPIVRSSTYCAEDDVSSSSTTNNAATSGRPGKPGTTSPTDVAMKVGLDAEKVNTGEECEPIDRQAQKLALSVHPEEGFWKPLGTAVQARLGATEGERFCEAFKKVHNTLVTKTLSLDDIERIATQLRLRPEYRRHQPGIC